MRLVTLDLVVTDRSTRFLPDNDTGSLRQLGLRIHQHDTHHAS